MLNKSSWKLPSAKGWKGVPGCIDQGKGEPAFADSAGHSPKLFHSGVPSSLILNLENRALLLLYVQLMNE